MNKDGLDELLPMMGNGPQRMEPNRTILRLTDKYDVGEFVIRINEKSIGRNSHQTTKDGRPGMRPGQGGMQLEGKPGPKVSVADEEVQ